MSLHSPLWTAEVTAMTSIAHGGETRGTATLLRRELILTGAVATPVPVISGNAVRGRLRRTAEEMYREVLDYQQDELPLVAIDVLRSGGSLAKASGQPLTGGRLRDARHLVPPLALFGAATGGRAIEGSLQVGKLLPLLAETSHLTGVIENVPDVFGATQLETYTRQDDAGTPQSAALMTSRVPLTDTGEPDHAALEATSSFALFRIETFPAGSRFTGWIKANHITAMQLAFLLDLLDRFTTHGRVGGRAGIGHGRLSTDLHCQSELPAQLPDWRAELTTHREDALTVLRSLA